MKPVKTKQEEEAELNFVIQTKSFFGSGGWAEFKKRINERIDYESSKIDPLLFTDEPIAPEQYVDINFHKAKRRAMLEIIALQDEMMEEVDSEYGQEPKEKTGFDIKEPE